MSIKPPKFPPFIPPITPLLREIAAMQERALRLEADRERDIIRVRVITGWDAKRVIDTALRRKVSIKELGDSILKSGSMEEL